MSMTFKDYWNNLNAVDWVSFYAIKDSGIALNAGYSHTDSSQFITKNILVERYNINTSLVAGLAGHQWVNKGAIAAAPSGLSSILLKYHATDPNEACTNNNDDTFYYSSLSVGNALYTNSSGTITAPCGYYSDGTTIYVVSSTDGKCFFSQITQIQTCGSGQGVIVDINI